MTVLSLLVLVATRKGPCEATMRRSREMKWLLDTVSTLSEHRKELPHVCAHTT